MVLARLSGTEDVVIGTSVNTRDAASADVIGMFVNKIPVRVKPARGKAVSEFLKEVSEEVRNSTRNSTLPFSMLVSEFYKGSRDGARNPFFDVSINYLPVTAHKAKKDVVIETFAPLQKLKLDMAITIHRAESAMDFTVQYPRAFFGEDFIARFSEQVRYTLTRMDEYAHGSVREVTALPEGQLAELKKLSMSGKTEVPVKLLHRV